MSVSYTHLDVYKRQGLEIRAAQLHNDAGMVGAVYYFRQQHGEA